MFLNFCNELNRAENNVKAAVRRNFPARDMPQCIKDTEREIINIFHELREKLSDLESENICMIAEGAAKVKG